MQLSDMADYTITRTTVEIQQPTPTVLYSTLEDADFYLESVLNTEAWDLSNDKLRTKALGQATKIIQSLNVPTFVSYNEVPDDIKAATVEIALKLLDGVDPEAEYKAATVKSMSFDKISQTNMVKEVPLHIIAGVPSVSAFNILRRYMPDLTTVRLARTT
jgi:hypothetical protein